MKQALVITGPSGAGKTTVANIILDMSDRFGLVHSATTRAPRGDGNDAEYIYVTKEEFEKLISNGDVLEYTLYGENYYGTPKSELCRVWGEGKIPLLILDLVGAKTLAHGNFDFCPKVFYVFEDINVIERRLYERELAHPTADGLCNFVRRKEANIKDYLEIPELCDDFFAFVRNTEAELCAEATEKAFLGDELSGCQWEICYLDSRKAPLTKELYESALLKIDK